MSQYISFGSLKEGFLDIYLIGVRILGYWAFMLGCTGRDEFLVGES